VDVELFPVKIHLFGEIVAKPALPHEPADMFDRGHAVGSGAGEPAFRRDFNHNRPVAYQLDRAVIKEIFVSLSIFVPRNRLAIQIPCHVQIPLSFISCPLGQLYIIKSLYICQAIYLGDEHLNFL